MVSKGMKMYKRKTRMDDYDMEMDGWIDAVDE